MEDICHLIVSSTQRPLLLYFKGTLINTFILIIKKKNLCDVLLVKICHMSLQSPQLSSVWAPFIVLVFQDSKL